MSGPTQPKLYRTCGSVMIDEYGVEQNNPKVCARCSRLRCGPCMWTHLRKCDPDLYLRLRNRLVKREITANWEISMPGITRSVYSTR